MNRPHFDRPHFDHNGFDREELTDILREEAFSIYDYEVIHRGENLFMGHEAALFMIEAVKRDNLGTTKNDTA